MKCPLCPDATLLMTERQGVEIDYCPQCRGLWLDRGKLDRLLDHAARSGLAQVNGVSPAYPGAPLHPAAQHRPDFADSDHHGAQQHGTQQHGYPRKKSWLSELFD